MTTFNDIHNEAMDLAYYALKARRRGNVDVAQDLFAKALTLEQAALEVMGDVGEPVYSTMYRSAATLALDCNDFRLAEQLASKALAGDPPSYLVWQLREVVEQATLRDHLRLDGVELAEDELQMSLAGGKIGHGLAPIDEFLPRADGMDKLFRKVWDYVNLQAQNEKESSEVPRPTSPQVLISPLRAGSVAVTLKVGSARLSGSPKVGGDAGLIEETLDVIETVATSDVEELATAYPDGAYRRNFVQLVRRIAPDGDKVRQVGFTAVSAGKARTFPLTKTKTQLSELSQRSAPATREETITGRLLFVDGMKSGNQSIKILQADGTKRRVKVPVGKMDSIVRSLWDKRVTALCTVQGKTATLVEVEGV